MTMGQDGGSRRRGSNLPAVGTYNQVLVLDLIRRAPDGISRSELAERTGLAPQTLTNLTRRLAVEGLIAEAGKVIAGPGKPRTLLALNPESRFAVGVHLDPFVDKLVVLDLAGKVVARAEHTPLTAAPGPVMTASLADAVNDLLATSGVPRDRLLGIGVAAPGPFDPRDGRLLNPPLLPAWHNVPLRDQLHTATDLPVVLEKDVVAAIVGEMWFDRRDSVSNAMFLYYGAGVGIGLAVEGSPVRGLTGNAGNIAHMIVDPTGPVCACGARGCLGVAIEPEVLLRAAGIDPAPYSAGSGLPGALRDLAERARAGDERARSVVETAAQRMARAVVEVNNLLDLDTVVVGGVAWSALSDVLRVPLVEGLASSRASTATLPVTLQDSLLGTDVAAVGAACLILDESFTARPADLMITA
ncbi:ROK family transcriptional regulator [Microbacterium sp. SLBN-111]|uniref:ROK family transcriptional regulator n=1 Tax=Microbacterium sp. SLBN-111 TaxID=3377733 RepID=UPI003C74EF4B